MRAIIEFRQKNFDNLQILHFPTIHTTSPVSASNGKFGKVDTFHRSEDAIPQVEVVMKEVEHTAGRSSYYDSFGVIRDVMQNHLTQALVYSLMSVNDVNTDSKETFGEVCECGVRHNCVKDVMMSMLCLI